jgi:hypothetical protein
MCKNCCAVHVFPNLFALSMNRNVYEEHKLTNMAECRGRVVNTPASYSGGPRFKSWLRNWLC